MPSTGSFSSFSIVIRSYRFSTGYSLAIPSSMIFSMSSLLKVGNSATCSQVLLRTRIIQAIKETKVYLHGGPILWAMCQAPSHRGAKRQVIVTVKVLVEKFTPIRVDKVGHSPWFEDGCPQANRWNLWLELSDLGEHVQYSQQVAGSMMGGC